MHGVFLAERLLRRRPDLCDDFVPTIQPLLKDDVDENREIPGEFWTGVRAV